MKYQPIYTYLEQNPDGDLDQFLRSHSDFVRSLEILDLKVLKSNVSRAFAYALKKQFPDLSSVQIKTRSKSDDESWIRALSPEAITNQKEVKDPLFKWCFEELEKVESLSERRQGYKAHIDQLLKENGEDLQDIANRLSLLLLEKFSQLTKVELATLKLSLSTIFNISSAEFKDVLQEHLSPKEFSMICKAKYSRKLNKEAEAEIDKVIKELQEESKKEEPNFGIKLGKKSSCTRENQIRLVYSFLYTSLKPKKKRAELDYVKVVSLVLEYILNDTDLDLSAGETQCIATRQTRLGNEMKYSSSSSTSRSSNISGRKIDILLKDEDETELCAIEFKCPVEENKKRKTMSGSSSSLRKRSDMSLHQEGKSMRINKCIAQHLKKGNDGCVVGVDFNGFSGHSYALIQVDQGHVCVEIDNFWLPDSKEELQGAKLKDVLLALYELKEVWLSISKSKEEEEEEEEEEEVVKDILDTYVFFSPKMAKRLIKPY